MDDGDAILPYGFLRANAVYAIEIVSVRMFPHSYPFARRLNVSSFFTV